MSGYLGTIYIRKFEAIKPQPPVTKTDFGEYIFIIINTIIDLFKPIYEIENLDLHIIHSRNVHSRHRTYREIPDFILEKSQGIFRDKYVELLWNCCGIAVEIL
jgi:hypothetical protein